MFTNSHLCIICGTKFKFIVDKDGAVPVDPTFWDYLLSDPVNKWRLIVYEQDWLATELGKVPELLVRR